MAFPGLRATIWPCLREWQRHSWESVKVVCRLAASVSLERWLEMQAPGPYPGTPEPESALWQVICIHPQIGGTLFRPSLNEQNWRNSIQTLFRGFPGGSISKESACNARNLGSIPGLGRSPRGEHGNIAQNSCLENPHGQRSLAGYNSWGRKELDDSVTKHTQFRPAILKRRSRVPRTLLANLHVQNYFHNIKTFWGLFHSHCLMSVQCFPEATWHCKKLNAKADMRIEPSI